MPSVFHTWTKREVAAPVPDLGANTEPAGVEGSPAAPPAPPEIQPEPSPTEMAGTALTSAEPGGEHLRKHIFGNKTYHPSHGRTTPFPEPGIS